MFRRIAINGINPTSELSGIQSNDDISVSGSDAGVVNAGDMPIEAANPPLPAPTQPQGFGRLSVEQACAEIEPRAKRISIVRPRGST
jgi:hypothetical protein